MYTRYKDCDPVASGKIEKLDQILPLFIMEVGSKLPGLPGLFIAGIISAGLSSMSARLNSVAGTIYEDFIRHHFPDASEKQASDAMKVLVVILGIVTLSFVFGIEKMGQVFRLNFVLTGLFAGTQLGLFSLGMFSRTANAKGALCGAIGSLLFMLTIVIGAQSLPKHPPLPVKTDGCDPALNATITTSTNHSIDDIPIVFQLSFMYYTLLGTIVMILIALPVSWATGGCEPFDERLLTPLVRSKNWKDKIKNDDKIYYENVKIDELRPFNDQHCTM